MDGYIVTTEVGYSVYIGSTTGGEIANVATYDEAVKALESAPMWNRVIRRSMSSYMPCA